MVKFLKCLVAMYRGTDMDLVHEPEEQVKKGERVFGTLTDELRRLYAVQVAYHDVKDAHFEEVQSVIAEAVEGLPKEPTDEQWTKAREQKILDKEYGIIEDMFQCEVMKAFPELAILPDDEKIVICKGWKVVVRRVPREEDRQDIIQVVKGKITVCDVVGVPKE